VISVERVAFHGDVFNLETEAGYYVAEGIVTHNCDCILMPETGSRAALSSAEIRTVLRDIADGAGAGLDDCGPGCAHDHGEPRGRAWRVERDEQIRERDRQIGKTFDSRAAAFAAIAREFSVSPRTVERAVYRR
jgi:hypothetical protein